MILGILDSVYLAKYFNPQICTMFDSFLEDMGDVE